MTEWCKCKSQLLQGGDECGNILPGVRLSNGQKSAPTKGDECDILINPKSRLQQVTLLWAMLCITFEKGTGYSEEVQTYQKYPDHLETI